MGFVIFIEYWKVKRGLFVSKEKVVDCWCGIGLVRIYLLSIVISVEIIRLEDYVWICILDNMNEDVKNCKKVRVI